MRNSRSGHFDPTQLRAGLSREADNLGKKRGGVDGRLAQELHALIKQNQQRARNREDKVNQRRQKDKPRLWRKEASDIQLQ
jgi:hypothetical protein